MRSKSIKGRLIATVVISQALLAAGLLFAGVFYTRRRLVSNARCRPASARDECSRASAVLRGRYRKRILR